MLVRYCVQLLRIFKGFGCIIFHELISLIIVRCFNQCVLSLAFTESFTILYMNMGISVLSFHEGLISNIIPELPT